jgi:cell wall-associated NlpC family hydrolase
MRRTHPIRCALGLVIVLCGASLTAVPAAADTVGQQQQQVKDVVAELERMHQKVDQYNEEYLTALNDKAAVEADIAVSQQHIADQQAALGVLQGQLANVAVEQFMGGGSGALGPLFTDPTQIDDGLQRQHLSTVMVNAGAASTDDYETLLSELAKEQKSLEKQQNRAQDLANQAEASRIKAESAAAALQDRLVQEKAKLGDLIEQEQQREADAAAAAYRRQLAASQAAAAAASNRVSTSGANSSASAGGNVSAVVNAGGGAVASPIASPIASGGSGSSDSSAGSDSSGGSSGGGSSGGDSGSSNPPPVSSRASVAVNAAASQIGVPYHFAQSSPGVAFDCSGLTAYAWGQAGVSIPHQSAAQYASTPHVSKDQAQPGDLIFFYSPISHVGIYVGGGSMIHAPATGQFVSYTTVHWDRVVGVGRPG